MLAQVSKVNTFLTNGTAAPCKVTWVRGTGVWVMGYGLWGMGYGVWGTGGYEVWDMSEV